ncbi:MAG TPA: PIN domain-containing protein [Candidatus Acidoferrum sp.]|nr:PIN domain-containing protein [Candidatus Acidoferrum sp.]
MSGRFFLDTNVFVYTFDSTAPAKQAAALKLVRSALDTRAGIISFQVVQEFLQVALRRFVRPLSSGDAEQYFAKTLRPLLAVQSSPALYGEALRLCDRFQTSWYDAVILAAAIEGECEVLYSEDFQDGQKFGELVVRNPFK